MPFPIDLKYIEEAERELGVLFPDNFKAKMVAENGGDVETDDEDWQLFPFFDKADHKRIARTSNHIILETKEAREWNNFPIKGVAIASNGYGDKLVFLNISEDSKELGEDIFIWYHETGEIVKVANSISELL